MPCSRRSRAGGRTRVTSRWATRVVLVKTAAGVPVDIALGPMPLEERAIARASEFRIRPDVTLLTCSAEDLVVCKAFAGPGAGLAGHRERRAAAARAVSTRR